MSASPQAAATRVAYLVNHYPAVSHSFIRREILALERLGVEVMRIALRGWDGALDPLPDVPTLAENGLDGFPADSWYGLVAPIGSPAAVIDKLNAAVNDGLNSPELRVSLIKLGIEARPNTPQDFAAALADQAVKYDAIVKSTGIRVE